MDQVVGDVDVGERRREPVCGERVATHDLDRVCLRRRCGPFLSASERAAHALGVAAKRTHRVTVGVQSGREQRADETACAGDEDAHLPR